MLDAERSAAKRLAADEAYRACGLPARHSDFQTPSEGPWLAKYQSLSLRLSTGFLVALLGNRGTGKTQMAACLCRRVVESGKSARYVRAMDVFLAVKATYRTEGQSERQALDLFTKPNLLVIDEAHERGETDWENRLLTYVVDVRYGAEKDTLLVSNQTPSEFQKSIGSSIYSRLTETGGVVVCDWPSFRNK